MIDFKNKKYWNILKGIAILSIVIGHSYPFLVPFVYLYHLAIFFFISGYLYSEEKYGDDPFLYFINKTKSNWKKFVLFNIFFILIHNILLKLNMIYGSKYIFQDFITSILHTPLLFCTENIGGPLWFVPVFIIASSIFGGIIYFSRKISNEVSEENRLVLKNVLIIAFTLIIGGIGVYLNNNNINIAFHIQTSLLVSPFYTIGYYMRAKIEDLSKVLRLIGFVICFGLLVYFAYYYKLGIELSANTIGNTLLFYPVSFIGIYFCLYLSKLILKIKYIHNYFNILGNYSFEIMASHFLVFKIIDFIYSFIVNINDPTIISRFPYSYPELWPIYIILGASIPAFLFYFINKEKTKKLKTNIITFLTTLLKTKKSNKKSKINKIISYCVLITALFLFLHIFLCSFLYRSNVYYKENNFISIIIAMCIFIMLYIVFKVFVSSKNNISIKSELCILTLIFTLIICTEIFVLNNLAVEPSWDFGVVFYNAESYVQTGLRETGWYPSYFEYFPNNIMLFAMLVKVIKWGGFIGLSSIESAHTMNLIFINLSYIMLYLTLRKKFGNRVGIFGMIVSLLFIAPILYSPIFYTDTLSLFVPISFIFFSSLIDYKKVLSYRNIIIFLIFGVLLFYGKAIKITSIIPFIAIIIHLLFDSEKRKILLNISFSIIVFFSLSVIFKAIVVDNKEFAFQEGTYGAFPYTHWVMMGIEDIDRDNSKRNSYGGYNYDDYKLTLSFDEGKKATKYNINEIISRIKKMRFIGYYNYLNKKAVNAWTDGLYFADVKLQLNSCHEKDKIYNDIFNNKKNKYALIYFSQGVQYLFIIVFLLGAGYKFYYHYKKVDIVRLSIIGICLFLLLWENRSRYLLNFIPLFIYIICEFYVLLYEKKNKVNLVQEMRGSLK